jgi:hypothetical protein
MSLLLIITWNSTSNRDNDIVLAYAMMALTLPIGFVVIGIFVLIGMAIEPAQLPSARLGMIVTSAAFIAAGYFQWFIAFPAVLKAFNKRHNNSLQTDKARLT